MPRPLSRPYDDVLDANACVVALFRDPGERYLSKLYDNDDWMKENDFR